MLTTEQKTKIIEHYQSGLSIADIAELLGNGKNTINRLLQKEGISKNLFNEETELKIIQEYLDGESATDLGDQYKCTKNTILNILRRHEIDRKPRGQQPKQFTDEEKVLIDKMWAASNGYILEHRYVMADH